MTQILNIKVIQIKKIYTMTIEGFFEIKCSSISDLSDINNFLGPKNRFSKYSEAIYKLNLN